MLVIYDESGPRYEARQEVHRGKIVPSFECYERERQILHAIRTLNLGTVQGALDFGMEPILRIHTAEYISFLQAAFGQWCKSGNDGDAVASYWMNRNTKSACPISIHGRLGYYSSDAGTPITAETWSAAYRAAMSALTAANEVARGRRGVFALTRPPGHHASRDVFAGYCFLNHAAIAAQFLLDRTASRVAILDIDYHHGNGTQGIFEDRADVLYVSIHADPDHEFPYFSGRGDESGIDDGVGFTRNFVLDLGTEWTEYERVLYQALECIQQFNPDALVVSLGLDTFVGDPLGTFRLGPERFPQIGRSIREIQKPTLFVLEGGYALDELGRNTAGVLQGFQEPLEK